MLSLWRSPPPTADPTGTLPTEHQIRHTGIVPRRKRTPWMEDGEEQVAERRHGMAPVEAMGACGTARPLQDLMGYMKIDLTVAAGSPPPPPPPRREERKEAAFSMAMAWSCLGGVEDGVSTE